mmetsp:Transcript_11336/g.12600  ORF Transcript_11336/g.12600 Transcript_11336/m.12600 type:complete len:402 (-) Transcript_11336:113-1318(-)
MIETNDSFRRRKASKPSAYNQSLLQNDHLELHYPYRKPRIAIESVGNSTYRPPENFADDSDLTSFQQFQHDHEDFNSSYLFVNTPKPMSFRRAMIPQTPARTTSNYQRGPKNEINFDYGKNSFFSYGCFCVQCVRTMEVGVLERLGRFDSLLGPGLHCFVWPIVDISGRLSLKIQQLDVTCETKTSDSVFCILVVTLQYRVIVEKAYDAFYRLTEPSQQIEAYIFDVIRTKLPRMTLDEVFANKSEISKELNICLGPLLDEFGYEIISTLLTDIKPAVSVVQSMNEINASKYLKEAMSHQAEANKVKILKEAEAQCETLYLQGVGIAAKRKAIAEGLKEPIQSQVEEGKKYSDISNLLLMTQYLDILKDCGASSSAKETQIVLGYEPEKLWTLRESLNALK